VPSVKMKALMWTKLPPRQSIGTIWQAPEVARFSIDGSSIPRDELEQLFCAAPTPTKSSTKSTGMLREREREIVETEVLRRCGHRTHTDNVNKGTQTLIDPRRAQNIGTTKGYRRSNELNRSRELLTNRYRQCAAILISSVKKSHDELVKAILSLDESILTAQVVKQLVEFVPSKEEVRQSHTSVNCESTL